MRRRKKALEEGSMLEVPGKAGRWWAVGSPQRREVEVGEEAGDDLVRVPFWLV